MKNNEELQEQFFGYVMEGNIDKVKESIEEGMDINVKTLKGNNILYLAAVRKRRDLFNYLIDKVNLDTQNSFGGTTLYELIKEDNMEYYIDSLIKHGANPNIPANNNITPLIQACADKKENLVEILLKSETIDVNKSVSKTGTTAFLMACAQSSMKIVDMLIKANADYNVYDSEGKNALLNILSTSATYMKKNEKIEHIELSKYLINIGIDLDYVAPSGMTAFYMVSIQQNTDLAKLMMDKGVNVNVFHELGLEPRDSALHSWCKSNNPVIVKEVLEAGAKLGVKDGIGNMPESFGFIMPKLSQVMLDNNADVNAILYRRDKKGNVSGYPVFSNVIGGGKKNIDIIKQMIDKGVNVTYSEEYKKQEPIYIAISNLSLEIMQVLLETKKIDLNQHIKINDKIESISPLSFLLSAYDNQNFVSKIEQKQFYEAILNAHKENKKNGVVSEIIDETSIKEIEKLVKSVDNLEKTLEVNKKLIFEELFKYDIKINVPNENGNTEVFFAKNDEYLGWLKDKGADLFHKNNDGYDLLYYSILNNKDTIGYLKNEYQSANHSTVDNWLYQLAFEDFSISSIKQRNVEQAIFKFLNNNEISKLFDNNVAKEDKPNLSFKEVHYKDEDGNTPLIVSSANDTPFLVSILIKLGANINEQNNLGETALMHAVNTGNNVLVDFLLKNGADKNILNNENKSALDIAYETNNQKVIKEFYKEVEVVEEIPKKIKP